MDPLRVWFEEHKTGRGIFKWRHYFEIYHRHMAKFRGLSPTVAEVGVYSGGSLEMWHDYFGEGSEIIGIDIMPECAAYQNEWCQILIGDQGDEGFWRQFRANTPALSAFIDDGSHDPAHQTLTFEQVFPHLLPGGVFICEDVHGLNNRFFIDMANVANALNSMVPNGRMDMLSTGIVPLQRFIKSVHFYPFVVVVEKAEQPVNGFEAPRHGTEWIPLKA